MRRDPPATGESVTGGQHPVAWLLAHIWAGQQQGRWLNIGIGYLALHDKLHDDEHFPPPLLPIGFPRLSRRRGDRELRSVRRGGEGGVPPLWSLHLAPSAYDMTAAQTDLVSVVHTLKQIVCVKG